MSPKFIMNVIKISLGLITSLIIGAMVKSEAILKDVVDRRFGQN